MVASVAEQIVRNSEDDTQRKKPRHSLFNCSLKSLKRRRDLFRLNSGITLMVVKWALKNIPKAKMKIIKITPVGRLLSLKSLGSTKNETQHFSPLCFDSGLPFTEDEFKWETTSGRSFLSRPAQLMDLSLDRRSSAMRDPPGEEVCARGTPHGAAAATRGWPSCWPFPPGAR